MSMRPVGSGTPVSGKQLPVVHRPIGGIPALRSVEGHPVVPCDWLFHELDNRVISTSAGDLRVVVFGILDQPDCRWVQLSLHGATPRTLTLRVRPSYDAGLVLERLALCLAGDDGFGPGSDAVTAGVIASGIWRLPQPQRNPSDYLLAVPRCSQVFFTPQD